MDKRYAKAVNDLRVLALDMIQEANSGHPGMALDVAPALYVLFANHLRIDPEHPNWESRDRFVLSSGHVSALLYAMLHMAGYNLSIEDLKKFRKLGSITPGHPELGMTPGVDATAGPLGQGIAQAVGLAMAEKHLSAMYGSPAFICHKTYVLCGDGCLQEGISQEALSLAGTLGLNNLILIYDRNGATLDAATEKSMQEDAALRFLASGWNVYYVKDGNDLKAIDRAISKAKNSLGHPCLIIIDSHIGYGSPLEGSNKCHGSPFKKEDYEATRKFFGADYAPFEVPEESLRVTREAISKRLDECHKALDDSRNDFLSHPEEAKPYLDGLNRDIEAYIPEIPTELKTDSSRNVSGKIIAELHKKMPFAFGGSADVASSVKTSVPGDPGFSKEHPEAHDIYFGIREFAMASAMNGILLHKGLVSYCGAFLVFSDYMKSAIRMSALEHLPAIYLFSHDSLAVGEDGPTHQPIEHLAALRSIPGVTVLRPADSRETYAAWRFALKHKEGPVIIILSRQNLPLLDNTSEEGLNKGAYRVYAPKAKIKPEGIIMATGSEVSLGIQAAKILEGEGKYFEVVSAPSLEVFEKQSQEYKDSVLHLPHDKTITLEMLSTFGWGKYGKTNIGVDRFGASGNEKAVLEAYGFTPEGVAMAIKEAF